MKKKKQIQVRQKPQPFNMEEALDSIANVVFSNLKLYIDKKFQELDSFFETLNDTKVNIATLSTLLHSKGLYTKEEFRECFQGIRESFGIVLPDGTMRGEVQITKYNFA